MPKSRGRGRKGRGSRSPAQVSAQRQRRVPSAPSDARHWSEHEDAEMVCIASRRGDTSVVWRFEEDGVTVYPAPLRALGGELTAAMSGEGYSMVRLRFEGKLLYISDAEQPVPPWAVRQIEALEWRGFATEAASSRLEAKTQSAARVDLTQVSRLRPSLRVPSSRAEDVRAYAESLRSDAPLSGDFIGHIESTDGPTVTTIRLEHEHE